MNIPKIYRSGNYQITHYNELSSTNDHAWHLISNNNPIENVVIVADYQTNGKGQYGRKWEARRGENITMTVIMSPKSLNIKHAFYLNILVSLAIINTLEKEIDEELKVKWPNDIYYQNKKLCGILIKNKVLQNHIKQSILGMGINLNQENFDPSLPNPTSLALICKKKFDNKEIVDNILENLTTQINRLEENGVDPLLSDYNNRLYKKDLQALFKVDNQKKKLTIKKVTALGTIHLNESDGSVLKLSSGLEYIL